MQFTPESTPGQSPRPSGVGLTALALAALVGIYFIRGMLHFFGGTPTPTAIVEQLLMCFGSGIALFLLWNYWKGQNWGRIFILLYSFVIATREFSALIDHNSSLTALMSQPVRFFHLLLATFLLYWLNTRPVRAWFKKMSATAADLIAEHLVGKLCIAVEKHSGDLWRLSFEHDAELTLACPWRVVLDDNLAFASRAPTAGAAPVAAYPPAQHSPEPRDEEDEMGRLLQNIRIKAVRVAPRTSDLFLTFEMGIELQTWSTDPHAHPWKFSDALVTITADAAGLTAQLIEPYAPRSGS